MGKNVLNTKNIVGTFLHFLLMVEFSC